MKNLVQVALEADVLHVLIAAVRVVGLHERLRLEGPYTLFAPTDEAFARLPRETIDVLLGDLRELESLLNYHMIPGKCYSADIRSARTFRTVQGRMIQVDGSGGINQARLMKADLEASNGVIHVIDTVLMP
jgi:uncharacterized surface protein with fasciclin (FAS1) repeats